MTPGGRSCQARGSRGSGQGHGHGGGREAERSERFMWEKLEFYYLGVFCERDSVQFVMSCV